MFVKANTLMLQDSDCQHMQMNILQNDRSSCVIKYLGFIAMSLLYIFRISTYITQFKLFWAARSDSPGIYWRLRDKNFQNWFVYSTRCDSELEIAYVVEVCS